MWGGQRLQPQSAEVDMSSLQPSSLPAEAPDTVEEQACLAVPSLNLYVSPKLVILS